MLKRIRSWRPSHGTVVAYLALFAALATGGAYAADKIGSGDIAKKAVKSKHIAKNAVKSKQLKDGGVQLKDLTDEIKGARAYVVVDVSSGPDPLLESPRRGFDSVERDSEGVYCLTPSAGGVNPDRDPSAVTVDWYHSDGSSLAAFWSSPSDACSSSEYEVRTVDFTGATSNDVAFAIVVP